MSARMVVCHCGGSKEHRTNVWKLENDLNPRNTTTGECLDSGNCPWAGKCPCVYCVLRRIAHTHRWTYECDECADLRTALVDLLVDHVDPHEYGGEDNDNGHMLPGVAMYEGSYKYSDAEGVPAGCLAIRDPRTHVEEERRVEEVNESNSRFYKAEAANKVARDIQALI